MRVILAPVFGLCFWGVCVLAAPHPNVSLDDAVRSTLQKNEIVGQSRQQLRRAEEQGDQTKSAIYPSLFLNGSYLVQPALADAQAAAFFPERQTTANLTLSQPLFRGFREFAAVRRQHNLFSAQQQKHLSQLLQLYQNVAESFMEVLALEKDLKNVDLQKGIYQGRIRDLQARTRRGESSTSEVLTAQSTASALDAEFQILGAKLRSARENFSYLTGLPVETVLHENAGADDNLNLKGLEEYLARIDERPDVKFAKEQYGVSDEEVAIARGGHWPTADLVGNYYFVRPDGFMKELKWDVQIRASLPLFEGGLRQSQVREASLKRGESDLELARLRRQSSAEIKSLFAALSMRRDQLKALKLSSDLAERNYQVLVRDSKRGLARSIDVQLGLTEYRIAVRTYDQARYQARLERIRLDLAAAMLPEILLKDM